MGSSKKDKFTVEQQELAMYAKVLGNPTRIAILEFIINSKSCICGDVVDEIGLAQATISQHLKELKNVGIIQGEITGTKTCYCINEDKWTEVQTKLISFFKSYPITNCC